MRKNGFTMLEMLMVTVVIAVVAIFLLVWLADAREQSRRSSCGSNFGGIIKCCHLYSDASPNLGMFPVAVTLTHENEDRPDPGFNTKGLAALSQLYNEYIKSSTQFSCRTKPTDTTTLTPYRAPNLPTGNGVVKTNYGYDPGHRPEHASAGIAGEYGETDAFNHDNSSNHGGDGQNVAIGAGSVEWWCTADARATKDKTGAATTDHIYERDHVKDVFPEELETHLLKD